MRAQSAAVELSHELLSAWAGDRGLNLHRGARAATQPALAQIANAHQELCIPGEDLKQLRSEKRQLTSRTVQAQNSEIPWSHTNKEAKVASSQNPSSLQSV